MMKKQETELVVVEGSLRDLAKVKRCPKCGEIKDYDQFSRNKNRKDGYGCYCKSCVNEYYAKYYNTPNGKTKSKARASKYYQANKEEHHARTNEWRRKHPEGGRLYSVKWREANKEHCKAYEIQHYANNREKIRQRVKRYQQEHPEKYAEYYARRYAKIRGTTIEKVDYKKIAQRDGYRCHICGRKIKRQELSFDHLIPLSKGGTHTVNNIRAAHRKCNNKRGAGRIPAQLILM